MHPVRKQRLYLVVFIVLFSTLAIGLMAYVLRENINLFFTPAAVAAGHAPLERRIRVGGCVLPGSVARDRESLRVGFTITDGEANLRVHYSGILPDLFSEGDAVVANGVLDGSGDFQASEVLAKHDEQYMPREVAESLKKMGEYQQTCGDLRYDS